MTDPAKEFEVTITVRNNRLKKRRTQLGLNQKDMAKQVGIPMGAYRLFEALRKSPFGDDGYWHPYALQLCDFFNTTPWELFTDAIVRFGETHDTSTETRELSAADVHILSTEPMMAQLPGPSAALEQEELSEVTKTALDHLSQRERLVIQQFYGIDSPAMSLREIGAMLDLCPQRISQIVIHSLRKLRHPSVTKHLRGFTDGEMQYAPSFCPHGATYRVGDTVWVDAGDDYAIGHIAQIEFYKSHDGYNDGCFHVDLRSGGRVVVSREKLSPMDRRDFDFFSKED
jgi:RNA polymerase sigma factor (sigma-70 family)